MPVESNILNRIAKDGIERHAKDNHQLLNSKHDRQERNMLGLVAEIHEMNGRQILKLILI